MLENIYPTKKNKDPSDCEGAVRALVITNYFANKRESIFWIGFNDITQILFVGSTLVFIRSRIWNRNFFLEFKNNTLPYLFLFLFPRLNFHRRETK